MNALDALPAIQPYVVTLVVLCANALGLANACAITRAQAGESINPEDVKINQKPTSIVFEGGNDRTARYRRAHRNALENTPLFMISAFVLTSMGASATIGAALFYPYAVARVLHSVCYVKAIQPLRTVSYVIGFLLQLVVLGLIGYGAFG